MKSGSLWQRAQSLGMAVRAGLPTKPLALLIATVAIGTTQSAGGVDIVLDQQRRALDAAVHRRVAIHARIGPSGKQKRRSEEQSYPDRSHFKYPRMVNAAR